MYFQLRKLKKNQNQSTSYDRVKQSPNVKKNRTPIQLDGRADFINYVTP